MGMLKVEVELGDEETTSLREELREAQAENRCLLKVLQRHAKKVFERCGIDEPPKGAQMGLFFRPARLVTVSNIERAVL